MLARMIKLTYFDLPVSRGEECRLALHVAGVPFEDNRVKFPDWPGMKATAPFGALPVYEEDGKPPIAQSNAILVLIGRRHGLHPEDLFEAARHESLLASCEELRMKLGPSLAIKDPDEKLKVRTEHAQSTIPQWGAMIDRQLTGSGPFVAGDKLSVADIKLYVVTKWFLSGTLDHIPATVLADAPKLTRLHDAVKAHPAIVAWYAR
jgi:glutathione S-transferase